MGGHGGGGHGGGGHGGGRGFRGGALLNIGPYGGGWGWPYPDDDDGSVISVTTPDGTNVTSVHGDHSPTVVSVGHPRHRRGRASIIGGEVASPGASGEYDPNYGMGDNLYQYLAQTSGMHAVSGVNNSLSDSEGGTDPFALAAFGTDTTSSPTTTTPSDTESATAPDLPDDLSTFDLGPFPLDLTDYDFDPLLHSGRSGTLRHPHVDFGFEDDFYSGFGRAPIMGCELKK